MGGLQKLITVLGVRIKLIINNISYIYKNDVGKGGSIGL